LLYSKKRVSQSQGKRTDRKHTQVFHFMSFGNKSFDLR